jgi:hypothetical protein
VMSQDSARVECLPDRAELPTSSFPIMFNVNVPLVWSEVPVKVFVRLKFGTLPTKGTTPAPTNVSSVVFLVPCAVIQDFTSEESVAARLASLPPAVRCITPGHNKILQHADCAHSGYVCIKILVR